MVNKSFPNNLDLGNYKTIDKLSKIDKKHHRKRVPITYRLTK